MKITNVLTLFNRKNDTDIMSMSLKKKRKRFSTPPLFLELNVVKNLL